MKKSSTRAWIVALSVAVILFVVSGIVANTISLFMTQFSTEFADTATMAQLALYFTIMTGTMAICQPIARKLFAKIDTRLVISLAVILAAGGFFAISFYTNYIGWMFSGVVIGFGFSFIVYLLGPILINNWFKKKAGTVLGVVLACSNLGGALFGTVAGSMIKSMGWQSAIQICALIAAAVGLIVAIFGLRYKPDPEKGECAYGEETGAVAAKVVDQGELTGLTFGQSLKTPWFWMIAVSVIVCYFGSNFQTQAAKFATTAYAFDIAQAGVLSTVLMIGAVIGKVLLGIINDKFGCAASYSVGCGSMVVGILVLVICSGMGAFFGFLGAFLFGFGFATMSIAPPFVIKKMLGAKHFAQIYGYVASIGTLTSMFSSNIYAGIFTSTGSYTGGMIAACVALVVGIIVVCIGVAASKKYWAKKAEVKA